MTDLSPPVLYPSDRVIPISTVPQCYTVTILSPSVLYPRVTRWPTHPHRYCTPVLYRYRPVPTITVPQCCTVTDLSLPVLYPSVIQLQTCPLRYSTPVLYSDRRVLTSPVPKCYTVIASCLFAQVVVFTFFSFLLTFHANSILTPRSIFDSPHFSSTPIIRLALFTGWASWC